MISTSEHFLGGAEWEICSLCFRVAWLPAGVVPCFEAEKKQTQASNSSSRLPLNCKSPSGFVLTWRLTLSGVLGALYLSDGFLGRMNNKHRDSEATACLTFLKNSEARRARQERGDGLRFGQSSSHGTD